MLGEVGLAVAEAETRLRTGAAGVFPFGLRRQPKLPAGGEPAGLPLTFRELPAEVDCGVPVDMRRRPVVRSRHGIHCGSILSGGLVDPGVRPHDLPPACGDGVLDWKRIIGIVREKTPRDIVFSVECGTPDQAARSLEYLGPLV
jgi:hypothetical protein